MPHKSAQRIGSLVLPEPVICRDQDRGGGVVQGTRRIVQWTKFFKIAQPRHASCGVVLSAKLSAMPSYETLAAGPVR